METKKKKNLDEEELLLVDLLHAPKGIDCATVSLPFQPWRLSLFCGEQDPSCTVWPS